MPKTKRTLIISGIIIFFLILIGIVLWFGFIRQAIFPNAITYLGLKKDFPFDGNNINIHLEYTSAPANWNFWSDGGFTFTWGDAITTSINRRECTELGLYRDYEGEWNGGCGLCQ
jgi:hypothetical protein